MILKNQDSYEIVRKMGNGVEFSGKWEMIWKYPNSFETVRKWEMIWKNAESFSVIHAKKIRDTKKLSG